MSTGHLQTAGRYFAYTNGDITLRIHYHRPDVEYVNEYGPWEAWLWDPDDITDFTPLYSFEDIDGDKVVTVKVRTGTISVGYIIRNGEWYDKDVLDDQFIDLTGILSGTLDFYIESGVPGGSLVKGDDVVEGIVITASSYKESNRNGRPEVVILTSAELPYEVTVDTFRIIRRTNGEVVGVNSIIHANRYASRSSCDLEDVLI